MIDKWANFLAHEKLHPQYLEEKDILVLLQLAEAMAKVRGPKIGQYKDRLESRRFLCETAMDLGIDLTKIKRRGKMAMGRGLLDAWNLVYKAKFGSNIGTSSEFEAARRDVKTKLCKQGIRGVRHGSANGCVETNQRR